MSEERVRWARLLQAIAQSGITYTENPFDRERFESVRAIAIEIAASASGEEPARLEERFVAEMGYGTPKVDVRGVVLRDEELLLVRELGETRWTLPGGWADVGDSPARAVEKEVLEEAGLETRADRVLAVYDRDFRGQTTWPAHAYKIYIGCIETGGETAPDLFETEEAAFFAVDALPALSPKTPGEHLARVLRIATTTGHHAELD